MEKLKLVSILVILLVGCNSNPVEPEIKDVSIEDYFPYDEYTNFTYRIIANNDTSFSYDEVNDRELNYEGQNVYCLNEHYYNIIINGEWREYDNFPSSDGEYIIFLKEPLEFGTQITETRYITKMNISLRTARFGIINNCIATSTLTGSGDTVYYAPEYGEIKRSFQGNYVVDLIEIE